MNEPGEGDLYDLTEGVPASFSDWDAKNWADLQRIWRELVPEYFKAPGEPEPTRRFRKAVIDPAQAGHVFERWVMEAFRLNDHETEPGWSVPGLRNSSAREQIDGLVVDGWQAFLVESKFRTGGVDYAPLALLHVRVGQRPPGCMGQFFSAFGFSRPALEAAMLHQPLRLLLFDGYNLKEGVRSGKAWKGMIKRAWVRSIKYGDPIDTPLRDDRETMP